jgi:hypothetical protein
MSWIISVAGSIGKFFADIGSAIWKWAAAIFAYRLGKRAAQQDAAEDAVEVKDKQLEIMSKPDAHRDALLRRMRGRVRRD